MARREGLQARAGVGLEIVGPHSSVPTQQLVEFARRNHLPFTWLDSDRPEHATALAEAAGLPDYQIPLVRLPGGSELRNPSAGEVSRALGIGVDLDESETVDVLIVGGGPGLGAAVYGASEGLETLVVEGSALGGQAGTSRRIENYLGFPAGISGSELTVRAVSEARKFGARTATPYRAVALEPAAEHHLVRLESGHEMRARAVVLATGAEYRRLPIPEIESYQGVSIFYAADHRRRGGARPRGSVSSEAEPGRPGGHLARSRRGARDALPPPSRPEPNDVGLPDPRSRARRVSHEETAKSRPHGAEGQLEAAMLRDGERIALSDLFLFLGHTAHRLARWHRRARRRRLRPHRSAGWRRRHPRDERARYFAVGDVRSGSVKRCATAVGEGATPGRSSTSVSRATSPKPSLPSVATSAGEPPQSLTNRSARGADQGDASRRRPPSTSTRTDMGQCRETPPNAGHVSERGRGAGPEATLRATAGAPSPTRRPLCQPVTYVAGPVTVRAETYAECHPAQTQ